jgi:hypothetical protein
MKYEIRSGDDLPETFEGWLWEEAKLIPRGTLSMIIGHDGVGKTSIAMQLAAQWTRDEEIVFMSMLEDGPEIIKSKLKAAGADLDMCVFQPNRPDGSTDINWMIPEDIERMEVYLRATGATVAILDSLDAHMSASPISHKARVALAGMHNMAQRLGIPVIFLHHFNKGGNKTSVDQAIGGARGIKAAFRNILVWGDPFDGAEFESSADAKATHALAVHKNSYGPSYPQRATMVYAAQTLPHPYWEGETVLGFELIDSTHLVSPSDIYSARHRKEESSKNEYVTSRDIAAETLLSLLANYESEWMPATELEDRTIAAGACKRTVMGTRATMCRRGLIEKVKRIDGWYWRITPSGTERVVALTNSAAGDAVLTLVDDNRVAELQS